MRTKFSLAHHRLLWWFALLFSLMEISMFVCVRKWRGNDFYDSKTILLILDLRLNTFRIHFSHLELIDVSGTVQPTLESAGNINHHNIFKYVKRTMKLTANVTAAERIRVFPSRTNTTAENGMNDWIRQCAKKKKTRYWKSITRMKGAKHKQRKRGTNWKSTGGRKIFHLNWIDRETIALVGSF